ncbi:MAG: class I SAM-dependent methyltransferase, partial [Cyclobacteriaceae bacterium]
INRQSWNNRLEAHYQSDFYDVKGFLLGKSSLNRIELELLGDIKKKSILHLQCHFGQDTISLARLGARTTGIDLSDLAIEKAKALASECGEEASFICCDIYDLPNHLDKQFDIVFTSYGTIGWLPDLNQWAAIIARYLKPGGKFIMVEFHPVVWMFDDDFQKIAYHYFNYGAILENESGTYADPDAAINQDYVMWNHSLSEVFNSLLGQGMHIQSFQEYDYSPYACFKHTEEVSPKKYRIKHLENKIPMVFALEVTKSNE